MTDISDGEVILLGPEERNSIRLFPLRPNRFFAAVCPMRSLHHPMLNPGKLTGACVRPPRDVSRSKDSLRTRLEEFIHHNTVIDLQPSFLSQSHVHRSNPNPSTTNHFRNGALRESRLAPSKSSDGFTSMEDDPVSFMQLTNGLADLLSQNVRAAHPPSPQYAPRCRVHAAIPQLQAR